MDGVNVPNSIEVFSMLLLRQSVRYLLLERAAEKRFAPGLWTGLGGRVEPDELNDLRASLLRELYEETGLGADQLDALSPRRSLLLARPGEAITLLLYFTAELLANGPQPFDCSEGTLHWVEKDQLAGLPFIDNAALVIPLLVEDIERDPEGREPIRLGAAAYSPDGALQRIVWA